MVSKGYVIRGVAFLSCTEIFHINQHRKKIELHAYQKYNNSLKKTQNNKLVQKQINNELISLTIGQQLASVSNSPNSITQNTAPHFKITTPAQKLVFVLHMLFVFSPVNRGGQNEGNTAVSNKVNH